MRATYGEYYSPSSDELREFMETAIVVPDANVLLGLYELSSAEREQLLDLLEGVSDRLWLAYQAGLEYQRNRMGVIRKQSSSYERARALHGASTEETLRDALDNLSLPEDVHNEIRPLLADLVTRIAAAVAPYDTAVSEIAARHVVSPNDALRADPVRARLDAIFEGRVGVVPDAEIKAARIVEGVRRQKEQIPPGYKDASKDTEEEQVGDYLLWAELLEFAGADAQKDSKFLFVTSDTKEDWFERCPCRSSTRVDL
jgi:hypothetical protein